MIFVMIKILCATVFFAVLVFGHVLKDSSESMEDRIVNGQDAVINDVPYTVALLAYNASIKDFEQICGAVIINSKIVLTAAHCTDNFTPYHLRIRAGSSFHNSGGQFKSVARFKRHENYNKDTLDYDIAIILLRDPLNLNTSLAKPIPYANQGSAVEPGTSALISGWGLMLEKNKLVKPVQIQKGLVSVIIQAKCINAYDKYNQVTTRMICADSVKKTDACQGDSGGPFVINGVLWGITSWGKECGHANYPGVYTNMAQLSNWVTENMKKLN